MNFKSGDLDFRDDPRLKKFYLENHLKNSYRTSLAEFTQNNYRFTQIRGKKGKINPFKVKTLNEIPRNS